jgi:hypothetical protein
MASTRSDALAGSSTASRTASGMGLSISSSSPASTLDRGTVAGPKSGWSTGAHTPRSSIWSLVRVPVLSKQMVSRRPAKEMRKGSVQ